VEHLIAQLAAAAGADHVASERAARESFASDLSDARRCCPAAVVSPAEARDVQRLVGWANETSTPLVPVSSGPPHFYGDTVPGADGAVIVDLTRLNRVLRIDRRNRLAVIEPGVTYPQVQAALAEHGMRVTPPLLPRANKSVVASLLERQPTLIPRYNFHLPEPLRDCGVVWGSGDVMYTGEAGSGPLELEEQWESGLVQAEPKGPAQTDFYRLLTGAQGTMGIVTWASVKCELVPAARKLLFVGAHSLEALVPFVYRLTRLRLGDELFVVNRACLARLLAASGEDVEAGDVPAWVLVLGLGGREHFAAERVAVSADDARALAARSGLSVAGALPQVSAAAVPRALDGSCESPWKLHAQGGSAEVFFLTTLDRAAGFIALAREVAAALSIAPEELGAYIQPQHQGVTHHVELSLPFDPADEAAAAAARRFERAAGERLIAAGAYFSRPYGPWAEPVYNRDAASREALRKVKAIFDPNGIMNPGKLCFGAPVASSRPIAKEAS
jgi:FAD/FMN-containing dehydrogenase